MKNKHFRNSRLVLIAVICALLAACSPQAEAVLPTETLIATPFPVPTQTPTPTPTPLPPDLPFSGIYFKRGDSSQLYILKDSLRDWEMVEFPEGSQLGLIKDALSPDQEWLFYFTGSIEEKNLTLNLMNLPDQMNIVIANLLSNNYPDDLLESIDPLVFANPEEIEVYPELESWDVVADTQQTFRDFLGTAAWSPDGKYLAFIGQMDGPSTDLYVCDLEENEILRITADENLIGRFKWSPKGEEILFEYFWPGFPIQGRSLHIADISDRNLSNPVTFREGSFWYLMDWFSDTEILTTQANDGAPNSGLQAFDFKAGKLTTLWPNYFSESAINQANRTVLLHGYLEYNYDANEELDKGLYYVDADGNWELVLDSYAVPHTWNGLKTDFLVRTREATYTFSPENGLVELVKFGFEVSMIISPDSSWVIFINNDSTQIFGNNDHLVLEIPSQIFSVLWGPNSTGFFYLDDGWLKYISLPEGEITVLEPCPERACWIYQGEIIWLEN
ncbi:MAG: hypothetical protein ABFS17_10205 [Chloroflexota bacterium]